MKAILSEGSYGVPTIRRLLDRLGVLITLDKVKCVCRYSGFAVRNYLDTYTQHESPSMKNKHKFVSQGETWKKLRSKLFVTMKQLFQGLLSD